MRLLPLVFALALQPLAAQTCSQCTTWNTPQAPFKIYGNTYYVGPHGLSSILITSPQGHILIDGGIAESAPLIEANIRTLGFRVEDVKLILNSHVHHDHAGGISALQRSSGAKVLASPWSANILRHGGVAKDDPQFGDIRGIDPVSRVAILRDGETLRLGPSSITAHFTPGHTPGGTSWTWQSCEASKCQQMVFADSVTNISADGYRFTDHPALLHAEEKSFAFLDATPCDILLTGHPEASDLWTRKAAGNYVDPGACKRLSEYARASLARRLAKESSH